MVEDLRSNHLPEGMRRSQVLALLGPPDTPVLGLAAMRWWLRPGDRPKSSWWLEVRFEADHLKSTFIHSE